MVNAKPTITIEGVDADDEAVAKILEDAAEYIRSKNTSGSEVLEPNKDFQSIAVAETLDLKNRT